MTDHDEKSDPKSPPPAGDDDMSLADLLGGDVGGDKDAPKRVDKRTDEPDSGMVKLAAMVASSTVETAKTPSIAPPPPAGLAAQAPAADSTGSQPVAASTPAIAPAPQRKSAGPVYALIAVVIVAAAAVIYFVAGSGNGNQAALEAERKANAEQMAKLMSKMEEMQKQKEAGGAVSKEDEARMAALKAELQAKQAQQAELAKQAGATPEPEAKPVAEEPRNDRTRPRPKADAQDRPKADAEDKPKAEKPADTGTTKVSADELLGPGKKEEAKPAADTGAGKADLDELLGGDKKKKEEAAAEKAKKKPEDATPKKPSEADVKRAMAPVSAKAQAACAKYSTGTVQVQVVVGNNGRVQTATPKGTFAGTTAGNCVAMLAKTAKFPTFSDPTASFLYPITLK
ncbi:MAG: hypothetical protein PHU25_15660 [Deltaproteobacteria bacterium]|nr:hypothetical protein [Deltaproteobacteria bacterium]